MTQNIRIRQANPKEASVLTELAVASEAYWGENEAYMNHFREDYCVTERFISMNPTYVMETTENILGFYSVVQDSAQAELEYFYVKVSEIGKGYGKMLWHELIRTCIDLGISRLEFVTSPEAIVFYEHMGAVKVDEVESVLRKGRLIPKLEYIIESSRR